MTSKTGKQKLFSIPRGWWRCSVFLGAVFLAGHLKAQPNLVLVASPPGESVGDGQIFYTTNETDIVVTGTRERISIAFEELMIRFEPARSSELSVGRYENVNSDLFTGSSPLLAVSSSGSCLGCGEFTIFELKTDPAGRISRFWAKFSLKCACIGWIPPITGEIRYRSSLAPAAPASRILRVPEDFSSIQSAITNAETFTVDTILVSAGIYTEAVDFLGKRVALISRSGPAHTFIIAPPGTAGVNLKGESALAKIVGFTLKDSIAGILISGRSRAMILSNQVVNCGAGIVCNSGSSGVLAAPTIRGNTISNCEIAIQLWFTGTPIVEKNIVTKNGLGIEMWQAGTPVIRNNIIRDSSGDGITMVNYSDPLIVQNLILRTTGNGVFWQVPEGGRGPWLFNNTIAGNTGAGIRGEGFDYEARLINNVVVGTPAVAIGHLYDGTGPMVEFNNIYSPHGTAFTGLATNLDGIAGNISRAPMFVSEERDDYRLRKHSPCIDRGTNITLLPRKDFKGNSRILSGRDGRLARVDQGAFEFKRAKPNRPPVSYCPKRTCHCRDRREFGIVKSTCRNCCRTRCLCSAYRFGSWQSSIIF